MSLQAKHMHDAEGSRAKAMSNARAGRRKPCNMKDMPVTSETRELADCLYMAPLECAVSTCRFYAKTLCFINEFLCRMRHLQRGVQDNCDLK